MSPSANAAPDKGPATESTGGPIRIGVSSCLLGAEVRFDGQHKRDAFLVAELARFVEWVPVCPEVAIGMGIPREPVRLVARGRSAAVAMLGVKSARDWTAEMTNYARERVAALGRENLSGYICKRSSPSCGMERVKIYGGAQPGAAVTHTGAGLFTAELMRQHPSLPVEEEGRLGDARLRENFVERVFAFHRLQALWQRPWRLRDLIAFHTAEKMALLAHSVEGYRALGRLVAAAKGVPRAELRARYQAGFMAALKKLATPGRHANVLAHMFGHFSDRLDATDRAELLALIEDHRKGLVPLVVPLTLLRHHARRLEVTQLLEQSFLAPHPKELMLRNHV